MPPSQHRRAARALAGTILFGATAPTIAHAATLRAVSIVHGPVVHIADLWSGAGRIGALALGPGPAPGASITVPASQLAAIARAYGVDWTSTGTAATVTRPGQPLAQASVLAALRAALAARGVNNGATAPAALSLSLPDYQAPMLDAGSAPKLTVDSLDYDAASGQFGAMITASVDAAIPLRFRATGLAVALASTLVASHRMPAGAILGAPDLTLARLRANALPAGATADPAALLGQALRHEVQPGTPITAADVERPIVATSRGRVLMALSEPGLQVSALGEAMQDGAVGDRIQVRNLASGAILVAEVTGDGTVRVDRDSLPEMPRTNYQMAAQ